MNINMATCELQHYRFTIDVLYVINSLLINRTMIIYNGNLPTLFQVGDTDAKTLTIKATKLTENNKYYFRVVAENEVGVSDPCTTDEPITAKLPFGNENLILSFMQLL